MSIVQCKLSNSIEIMLILLFWEFIYRYILGKCLKSHRLAKFNGFSAIGMKLPTCEGTMLQIVVSHHIEYCATWIWYRVGSAVLRKLNAKLCEYSELLHFKRVCSSRLNSAHIELCIRVQVDYVRKIIIALHCIVLCCAVSGLYYY